MHTTGKAANRMIVRSDLRGVLLPAVRRDGADDIQTFDQFVRSYSPTANVPYKGAGPGDCGYISPDALVELLNGS